MIWRKLSQLAVALLAAGVVLFGVLYVIRPTSKHDVPASARADAAGTTAAETAFAPVVPLPTWSPTPAPDTRPRVVDLATGRVTPVDVPSNYAIGAILSDGSIYAANPQGPALVVGRDGSRIAALPVPMHSVAILSSDRRYVAWISQQHVEVYDARTRTTSRTLPSDASFSGSLPDGGLIMPGGTGVGSYLVDATGAIVRQFDLPVSPDFGGIAPGGNLLAWSASDGVHIYDRSTGHDRTYFFVEAVVGGLAWSPDRSEIAYIRALEDNVYVRLLDLASGEQRDVYSAPADLRLDHLQFIGQHDLQFELKRLAVYQLGDVPLRGPRYAVHDDGTDGHYLDPADPPWSACGPACGLPPQGYEDGHDIAWWCEEYGNGFCRFHLVYVDRAKETARELATIDEPQSSPSLAAVSPDGRQVAVVTDDTSGSELLHLVDLIGLNSAEARDIPLGYSFVPDAAWFPDGNAVLLYGPGP